ncbi:MAG: pyruvate dehydrogenase complex dihydrolipoamide acetyltransferase [Beijerinckiaceae bacterium]|nr:pyruvate dehydrogenase complex dihydrolipoamide acetyltransferase [Beijerinckiaceae bacterium]
MPVDILMPALSPTMEKGNLAKWLKKEGDTIKSGDVLAEIETDKATMEVEAVDEGVLAKILVPDGSADVPVNQVIGIITQEGEDASSIKAPAAAKPVAAAPVPSQAAAAAPTPLASKPNGAAPAGKLFASPLARRLAKQAGLDLALISGSGPRGRIIERDVRAAEKAGPQVKPAAASAAVAPVGMSDETVKKFFEPGSYEEVPHDGMRKTIARRLVEAKQTIPHFYLSVDCELDALLSLREQINKSAPLSKEGKPLFKISVNDFIIKALAVALQRVPDANATWTEAAMLKHRHSDVGVAVSIPGGLITPVIRKAETKSLPIISNEMKDYAARAKARKLKPSEYEGGTTAVSNLGMFGIKNFSAVINPPHATILAVGAGEQRVIVKNGAPAVATVMSVTLSTDHRAVDGALGAELISAFKKLIEAPIGMLV